MRTVDEFIYEAEMLPVDDQLKIVDSLLRALDRPDPEIEKLWMAEVRKRLEDLRAGRSQTYSAEEVFREFGEEFSES